MRKTTAMRRHHLAALLVPLLSACATTPQPIAGGPFLNITPQFAQQQNVVGERVRWGGIIIEVVPGKQETCFEVLAKPLDSNGQPWRTDKVEGRFVACAPGIFDPAIHSPGRELTVVGTLKTPLACKLGDHEYRCAYLPAEALYLWPKRDYYGDPYWYDPFWGRSRYPGPYYRW